MSALTEYVAEESQAWAAEFLQERIEWLRRRKIRATGGLAQSLDYQVIQQAQGEAVTVLLAFQEHGRYIDMRRPNMAAGGDEYIKALEQWIQDKGLQRKMINRYVKKYGYKTVPNDVLNRIAWGIARKRAKRVRRRQWYNKPKSAAITDLYNRIAQELLEEIPQELKQNLNR